MNDPIRAVVALGNPGADHASDRHNVGFWLGDRLAERWRVSFSSERKFKGDLARRGMGDASVWLLKPATFMNRSGDAVQPLCAFHKMAPESVLVVHDELDLPAGTARFKQSGGHGGHNGLRDITRVIGTQYKRLRIGIGHPGDRSQVLSYVLGTPSPDDRIEIDNAIDAGIDALEIALDKGWDYGAQKLNSRKAPSS
ncbi:peptidyl-tRNA hydrolase [Salinisphaera shabanensis T35B1]|uniref:aminoacyl-tRNA hydrolase n=1 Tax=Salinisphaera shabanensis TaxID=180542 RepID=UPI00333E7917